MQFLRNLAKAITPRPTDSDRTLISDEKLDALIIDAKRERGAADDRKPVFDFEPTARPVAETPQQIWVNPAYDRGITPSRPFGRR